MNPTPSGTTPAAGLLDRVTLSPGERRRAEAALRRGEYLGTLLLDLIEGARKLLGSGKLAAEVKAGHRLGPTA